MFETSDTAPVEGVELGDFVRARARLEHAPDDVPAVVTMLKLPDAEAWRRVDRTWRARMEQDARLARVVDEFVEDHMRDLRGDTDDGEEIGALSDQAPEAPRAPESPSFRLGVAVMTHSIGSASADSTAMSTSMDRRVAFVTLAG